MFQRLRQFWSRRGAAQRRDIFCYHDGQRKRRIDPWAALLDLWTDPEHNYADVVKGCQSIDEKRQAECQRDLETMMRRAFQIPVYDGERNTGLTMLELHTLHGQFAEYIGDLKKKLGILPTRSPLTDSESSAPRKKFVMRSKSASGSSPAESTSAAPTSSSEPSSNPSPPTSPDPSGTTPSA